MARASNSGPIVKTMALRHAFRALVGVLALALTVAPLAVPGCRGRGRGEVVLGAITARTGARAPWGEDLYRGMSLAVDLANARGGLLGRRVRLVSADDGSHEEGVTQLVNRLCDREGALVVFGEVSSVVSERAAQASARKGVPFVATGSTARDVTRTGEFAFRTVRTDAEQAQALARYARQTLQKRRAAVVYRRSSLLQLAIADAFAQAFRQGGGEVVLRDTFTDGDAEMVHLAARVRVSGADVMFVPAIAQDAARVVLAARQGRVGAQILGSDGWSSPGLTQLAGEAATGAVIAEAFAPSLPRPEADQFIASFRERYRAVPGSMAARGFDSVRWVLAAAQRAQTLDPRTLRDALAGSELDDGVVGPIAVDARRVLNRPVNLFRIERDGLSFVTAVPSP